MIASHSCCRFVSCTSMIRISCSTTSQRCSIGSGDISMLSYSLRQILTLPSECRSRNRDSSDQATFFLSSTVKFWWACANCSLRFLLSWQECHPVWSSAAVAHLLQGSTCCVFRDGILHTLVVTSGYLSYFCLSIISTLFQCRLSLNFSKWSSPHLDA